MREYKTLTGGHRQDFASLDEMVSWIDETPHACKFNYSGSNPNAAQQGGDGWHGTANFTEAQGLVRYGWPKGRAELARAVSAIPPIQQARGRINALGFDVAGAYPNVPMAIAGEPACMVTVGEAERATRPYVRFRVNCAASAAIDGATIKARGAVLLAYVDELEQAGARCEIVMECSLGHGKDKQIETSVMVKRADERLDIDRLSYVLVNPSFLRRHMFAVAERLAHRPLDSYGGAYGPPADIGAVSAEDTENAVCFGSQCWGETQWTNPAKAAAHIRAEILKACGDLNGMLDAA